MDEPPPPENQGPTQMDPIFPTGVVIEIMSRLPVKALTQCQLVCKDWQSLIHDKYFTQVHSDRSDIFDYWYNRPVSNNNREQSGPGFTFLHMCNGLLIMRDNAEKKYCLWNPATRRVLDLPDPHVGSFALSFSFVPTDKSYRTVSFYNCEEEIRCEVLTLGGLQAGKSVWRQLDFPRLSSNKNRKKVRTSMVSSAGGAVHCVLVTSLGEDVSMDVVSLELENEKFSVSRLPKLIGKSSDWKNYWDMDWDGKLVIVDVVGENMEVMELEDYKKGRWCEQKKVIHLPFLKKDGDENKSEVIPLFAQKDEICFWLKDLKIFKYAIGTGKCTDIHEAPTLFLSIKMLPYRPSLISFEGMVPDTKLERFRPRFKSFS